MHIRRRSVLGDLGKFVPLKYLSGWRRQREMRPRNLDKKEAASPSNLRHPVGNAHGLSLYSNKVTGLQCILLNINLRCLWINLPDSAMAGPPAGRGSRRVPRFVCLT